MTRHKPGDAALSIAALIRREQDSSGASYMDIAKATGLSKAKIGQMADPETHHQVRPDTIEKLATGLRLPLNVVRRAALVTAGITPGDEGNEGRVELLAYELTRLDERTFGIVEAMIRAAADKAERG